MRPSRLIVIKNWGYQYALGGFVVVGACGCVLAFIIYKCGTDWINVVLPPAAMGPVVALIGRSIGSFNLFEALTSCARDHWRSCHSPAGSAGDWCKPCLRPRCDIYTDEITKKTA